MNFHESCWLWYGCPWIFDASHVLFWFNWLMCLRKEASWISGVSQFVKWMSWFCLGGNISYYMTLYDYMNLNDTTLLQISLLFTRVPFCFKCIENHLSWVMSDSPDNVSTSNFMFPSRKWVKSLLISKRALKNSILHVGNPIGLQGWGLGGFGAFWSSQLLRCYRVGYRDHAIREWPSSRQHR